MLLIFISTQSFGQLLNQQNVKLSKPYNELSRLSQYLYDSVYYENSRNESDFSFSTFTYLSDGNKVEAYLCSPKKVKNRKLPLVIYNRGGTGNYGKLTPEIFPYFLEIAKEGFIVVGSNYRFVNDQGKFDELGGSDVNDVINLYHLVTQWPQVDGNNIFVMGLSRGGLMTYCAARQLKFNAAAVISGVSNSVTQYEYRPIFIDGWNDSPEDQNYLGLRKILPDFEEKRASYLYDRSPTAWANEIESPVLILHSRQDGFVPVSQALSMAQALQVAGVPYQLKVYEKKSHALPSWAFDSTAEIIDWFKNYMKK